jgi:hypothetical protein
MPAARKKAQESPTLTAKQDTVLKDIQFLLRPKSLGKYHNRNWDSLSAEEQKDLQQQHKRLTTLMVRACRVGLANHPIVAGWAGSRRVLGEWDTLRDARVGLEKGVKRAVLNRDLDLSATIQELQQPREGGKQRRSLEAVRRLLIQERKIRPMTQQGFNKRVKELNTVEGMIRKTEPSEQFREIRDKIKARAKRRGAGVCGRSKAKRALKPTK